VRPDDTVYHLGDFSFAAQHIYLPNLNGTKFLVLGNHDPTRLKDSGWWADVLGLAEIAEGGEHIVLCHYAMRVWNRSHHGSLHLYGHSHGTLPGDSQSCDVGVDCWDFRPVTLDEIKARLATLPKRLVFGRRD
jgi:calcineurin-like phosphoesterase family protein